jgi:hypothetical protein
MTPFYTGVAIETNNPTEVPKSSFMLADDHVPADFLSSVRAVEMSRMGSPIFVCSNTPRILFASMSLMCVLKRYTLSRIGSLRDL